jgi:hypothetical protein
VSVVGGQSSSLWQGVPFAGVQTVYQVWQVASSGQLFVVPHSSEQNVVPLASATQCCCVPSTARGQS